MIREENGLYIVEDYTESGFIVRSDKARYCFKSIWNKDLCLLNFYYAYSNPERYEEYSHVLTDKEDEENRRCVLAKNRHLKFLKLHLGMEEVRKEKPRKKVLWKSSYYNSTDNIKISSFTETDKMFGDYKKCYMKYTEVTPEKEKLTEEYNKRYQEFKEYEKEILKKIFG